MTTFHVGLRDHLGTFLKVKDRYLEAPYPAWTAIGVVELAVPDALVEIRVTAKLRRAAGKRNASKQRRVKRGRQARKAR
jgi:enamine deaminase RidA (YjgF/YER057c/UK114 family)